jgi:hypothetical protein
LQNVLPAPQETAHAPLEQTLPLGQAWPHAPQLALSVSTFAQKAPASSPASLEQSN